MAIQDLTGNPFAGQTRYRPRPAAGDGTPDYLLKEQQQQWDAADAFRVEMAQREIERDQREVQERATDRAQRERAATSQIEAEAKAAFVAGNPAATEARWNTVKDDLINDRLIRDAHSAEDQTRQHFESMRREIYR